MARPPSKTGTDRAAVNAFLRKVAMAPKPVRGDARGRLLFVMDATLSRQPSWDMACRIQAEMFDATAEIGGLDVQLVFFRGHGEFRASGWVSDARALGASMTGVQCRGGLTQIGRALDHALAEARKKRINALVYVGDCVEENPDRLCAKAGELGLLGVPCFMFHEGGETVAAATFREIARLTGGAYCPFDPSAAETLKELLRAVAVYAAGGRAALEDMTKSRKTAALAILRQLPAPGRR
jgi:hypothetical protein